MRSLLLLILTTIGFSSVSNASSLLLLQAAKNGSSEESMRITYPENIATDIANAMSECGYNGGSRVGTYNAKSFDVGLFIKKLKKENESCERKYSTSKKSGIRSYKRHVSEANKDRFSSYECVSKYASEASEKLSKYMREDSTVAVISDIFDAKKSDAKGGDSASCAYYNFYVFRESGTVLNIEFAHTD